MKIIILVCYIHNNSKSLIGITIRVLEGILKGGPEIKVHLVKVFGVPPKDTVLYYFNNDIVGTIEESILK